MGKRISSRLLVSVIAAVVVSIAATAAPSAAFAAPNRWIGFYATGVPSDMAPLDQLESKVGTRAAVVNFFVSDSEGFPANRLRSVASHGSIPLVTLEFWSTQSGALPALIAGSRDASLTAFANQAKAYGGEIWLRPFHEMNGSWYPWSGTAAGNRPQDVVSAWRHVHDIFAAAGATNVKFVWCPNDRSLPNTTANSIAAYWPGDAYTDMIALDGYNFGTSRADSAWTSFDGLFANAYAQVTSLTSKPLFIAETGSSEVGGNKAAWITNMFAVIPASFPRIEGVVWFNALNEGDLRVDSSAASLAAFKAGAATWTAPAASPAPATGGGRGKVKRVAGSNRYATAVAISRASFASADTVLIATGQDYADALAASPLAGALKAPVLLVPKSWVPADVLAEIARLGATKAIIAGGESAVSANVVRTLQASGVAVERVAGAGRYGTAAALAARSNEVAGKTSVDTVFITRGDSFADALGVSATAYNEKLPVLLVRPAALPAETSEALRRLAPKRVVIIGGPAAISTGVENAIRATASDVIRVAGDNRYATSAAVAAYSIQQGWTQPGFVGVAAGTQFPDALGGGAATGGQGGVLLLTGPSALPNETKAFLTGHAAEVGAVNLFGGTLAVDSNVEAAVASACQ